MVKSKFRCRFFNAFFDVFSTPNKNRWNIDVKSTSKYSFKCFSTSKFRRRNCPLWSELNCNVKTITVQGHPSRVPKIVFILLKFCWQWLQLVCLVRRNQKTVKHNLYLFTFSHSGQNLSMMTWDIPLAMWVCFNIVNAVGLGTRLLASI